MPYAKLYSFYYKGITVLAKSMLYIISLKTKVSEEYSLYVQPTKTVMSYPIDHCTPILSVIVFSFSMRNYLRVIEEFPLSGTSCILGKKISSTKFLVSGNTRKLLPNGYVKVIRRSRFSLMEQGIFLTNSERWFYCTYKTINIDIA